MEPPSALCHTCARSRRSAAATPRAARRHTDPRHARCLRRRVTMWWRRPGGPSLHATHYRQAGSLLPRKDRRDWRAKVCPRKLSPPLRLTPELHSLMSRGVGPPAAHPDAWDCCARRGRRKGGGGGMSSRPPDLGPEWVCLVGREGGSPVALPGTKSSPTSPPCCRLWSWGPGRPSLRPRSQARASETAAVQGTPPRIGAGGAGEQAAAIFPAPGRLPAHEWRRRGAAQHAATCGTIELERLRHMRDG